MDELKLSTERVGFLFARGVTKLLIYHSQVSEHVRRIEAVEKDLKALRDSSVPKDDLSRLRTEVKKLYDGLHVGMPLSIHHAVF